MRRSVLFIVAGILATSTAGWGQDSSVGEAQVIDKAMTEAIRKAEPAIASIFRFPQRRLSPAAEGLPAHGPTGRAGRLRSGEGQENPCGRVQRFWPAGGRASEVGPE